MDNNEDLKATAEVLGEIGTWCNKCSKNFLFNHTHCKKCDSLPEKHEMRNYQIGWGGYVYCTECGEYVRDYDPT
jgi:hypothetical protein